MARKALIHKNTNLTTNNGGVLSPKLPTAGTLQKGEIAVNYKNGYETLSIENDLGEVVPFASLEQIMSYVDNSLPNLELSSNYSTSDLENEDLQLAEGDSYEEAFSKLEKAILDNEETIASSLNDLNDKKIEIDDIPITSVNGQTGAVIIEIPENQLSNNYSPSTLINEDLFLEVGDTYEEAFSKLEKTINNNEHITAAALTDLDGRIPTKTSDLDNDSGFLTFHQLLKTINNESLIGSGNITIQGGDGDTNIIETIKVNGTTLTPDSNKAVNITVPAAVTESTVSGWGFTKNTGTYSKPNGGIPKSDLTNDVQTSLGKADTALQSFTESDPTVPSHVKEITTTDISNWNNKLSSAPVTSVNGQTGAVNLTIPSAVTESTVSGWGFTKNSGTVTGVKINGTTKNPTSGVVDLGTVLTSFTETDPTVSAWAKASTKPTYTAAEVGALPDTYTPPVTSVNGQTGAVSLTIPAAITESTVSGWGFTKNTGTVSSLSDLGIIATTTELNYTDGVTSNIQTLLNAKGTYSKPSGGIPASDLAEGVIPTVPTNVSSFTNDAGYLTSASVITIYSGSTAPNSSLGNNGDIYIQTS